MNNFLYIQDSIIKQRNSNTFFKQVINYFENYINKDFETVHQSEIIIADGLLSFKLKRVETFDSILIIKEEEWKKLR